jgi:hypothetical protein
VEGYEAEIQTFAATFDAEPMTRSDSKADLQESLDEDIRRSAERETSQPPPDEEW